MFTKPMRIDRTLSDEEAKEILKKCEYGILSTMGEDGYPYGVPLSYVYDEDDNSIIFHCAMRGKKIDNISFTNKASFAVVGDTLLVPENFTTRYESTIVFGTLRELKTEDEKIEALTKLVNRLTPGGEDQVPGKVRTYGNGLKVFKLDIEYMSAKANRNGK